jgi:hypothetical protein
VGDFSHKWAIGSRKKLLITFSKWQKTSDFEFFEKNVEKIKN